MTDRCTICDSYLSQLKTDDAASDIRWCSVCGSLHEQVVAEWRVSVPTWTIKRTRRSELSEVKTT